MDTGRDSDDSCVDASFAKALFGKISPLIHSVDAALGIENPDYVFVSGAQATGFDYDLESPTGQGFAQLGRGHEIVEAVISTAIEQRTGCPQAHASFRRGQFYDAR
jgi:hypothetical protein